MRAEWLVPPVPGITLRPTQDDDRAFLEALYRTVRDPELAATGWDEATRAAFVRQQFEAQDRWYRTQYLGAAFLVIERLGVPVGRIYLHETAAELRVMEVSLMPEARGQGLGTALLTWVVDDARERGRAVTLHVESFNRVRRLYARMGFVEAESDGVYIGLFRAARGSGAVEHRLDVPPVGVHGTHE
jgi:GNAT superfamily N-acetyltransferase